MARKGHQSSSLDSEHGYPIWKQHWTIDHSRTDFAEKINFLAVMPMNSSRKLVSDEDADSACRLTF